MSSYNESLPTLNPVTSDPAFPLPGMVHWVVHHVYDEATQTATQIKIPVVPPRQLTTEQARELINAWRLGWNAAREVARRVTAPISFKRSRARVLLDHATSVGWFIADSVQRHRQRHAER